MMGLRDPDVQAWIKSLGALVSVKRTPGLLDGVEPGRTNTPQVDLRQFYEQAGDEKHTAFSKNAPPQNILKTDVADETIPWTQAYKDVTIEENISSEGQDEDDEDDMGLEYVLCYTPTTEHGKPQRTRLDAKDGPAACFEAANILGHGCKADDLSVESE